MTFFRYARTKGGGMGYFAMFYPVLHCRNALKVRYLLYYTHNIAQGVFCRLWRAANVSDRQTQSKQTTRHAQNAAKIRVPLCLCFAPSVCLSVCLSLCLSLFVSLSVCFPVPFCLNVRVNSQLNSYTER